MTTMSDERVAEEERARAAADKKWRIALGVGGFAFLLLSTPCVLWLMNTDYGRPTDTSGIFGSAGLIGFVLFVGLTMLYHAFKTPKPSKKGPQS